MRFKGKIFANHAKLSPKIITWAYILGPRLRISISIRIASVLVSGYFVCKGVRIESLSELFYPDADNIRTAFSKIRRQKDINFKIVSNITKCMCVHPNIIKSYLRYLSC